MSAVLELVRECGSLALLLGLGWALIGPKSLYGGLAWDLSAALWAVRESLTSISVKLGDGLGDELHKLSHRTQEAVRESAETIVTKLRDSAEPGWSKNARAEDHRRNAAVLDKVAKELAVRGNTFLIEVARKFREDGPE